MNRAQWSNDLAGSLVKTFRTQAKAAIRKDPDIEKRRRTWIGAALFVLAVLLSSLGALVGMNVRIAFFLSGLAVPMIAGAAGAILQTLWALYKYDDSFLRFGVGATALFGAMRGSCLQSPLYLFRHGRSATSPESCRRLTRGNGSF